MKPASSPTSNSSPGATHLAPASLRRALVGFSTGVLQCTGMNAKFFPKAAFRLTRDYGRRWAVFQSFALGGSIDEILRRAQDYCDQRCPEFGKTCPAPVEVDRRYLKDYSGFYPASLIEFGWRVTLSGETWTVEPPSAS